MRKSAPTDASATKGAATMTPTIPNHPLPPVKTRLLAEARARHFTSPRTAFKAEFDFYRKFGKAHFHVNPIRDY